MSVYRWIILGRVSNKLNCSYLSEIQKSEHRHVNKWLSSHKDQAAAMPLDIAGCSTSKISEGVNCSGMEHTLVWDCWQKDWKWPWFSELSDGKRRLLYCVSQYALLDSYTFESLQTSDGLGSSSGRGYFQDRKKKWINGTETSCLTAVHKVVGVGRTAIFSSLNKQCKCEEGTSGFLGHF